MSGRNPQNLHHSSQEALDELSRIRARVAELPARLDSGDADQDEAITLALGSVDKMAEILEDLVHIRRATRWD